MMLRARSIARASAVKMELSVGRIFLIIVLFKTASQAVLSLSLEPSVNIYIGDRDGVGGNCEITPDK